MPAPLDPTPAFRALERALIRRRLRALGPLLTVEFAVLALLVAGFVFWQTRLPLAAAAYAGGVRAAAIAVAERLALLAVAGGVLAGVAHRAALERRRPGPEWLALPLAASRIHRHLAWGSRRHALWIAPLALGVLVAGTGLLPLAWLLLLAAATVAATLETARLGTAIAVRLARTHPGAARFDAATRVLARAPAAAARGARRPAAWRRAPAWRALMAKDARLSGRPGPVRARLAGPSACVLFAIAAWAAPLPPGVAHAASAVLLLLAAGLAGEWLIAACASDPPALLRALPIGLGAVWGARARWLVLASLAIGAAAAFGLRALPATAVATE